MKRLKIDIKRLEPNTGSKWVDYLSIIIIILIGLCLSPLLIAFIFFGNLYNLIFKNKEIEEQNFWNHINTGTSLNLSYRYVDMSNIPDHIAGYFDIEPIIEFTTEPKIQFFEGYFTDFKIENKTGLYVQKIIQNETEDDIEAIPLYFFNYVTNEIIEIRDLKGYELDIKGSPDNFMITAIGEDDILEIHLTND